MFCLCCHVGKTSESFCKSVQGGEEVQGDLHRAGPPERLIALSCCQRKACLSKQKRARQPPPALREWLPAVLTNQAALLSANGAQHQDRGVSDRKQRASSTQRARWCHPQTRERRIKRLCFPVVWSWQKGFLCTFCGADLSPGGLPSGPYVSDKQSAPLLGR